MGKEKKEKDKRARKKGNRALRTMLCIVQHLCLGVMVLSMIVVVCNSTVRVQGFKGNYGFSMYAQDKNRAYEESDMFNSIFGYAAADIIRYGVVSSQLETDGTFDGGKVIDVTAYNYRDIGLPEQYVTADYRLEDLLKWTNYGFEWTTSEMTQAQAKSFLADRTRLTIVDPKSKYYNTSDASYLKSDVNSYTFVNDVSANRLWVDSEDYDGFVDEYRSGQTKDDTADISVSEAASEVVTETYSGENVEFDEESGMGTYNIMVNRYKTVEDKNLEEYVSDWDIYYDLCHNVQNAAKSLSYNYSEYLNYGEYYSRQKSNLRYLIMKTVGDDTQIYSNLEDGQDKENILEYMSAAVDADTELTQNAGKYIYYSPADMIYRTNTTVEEATIREILQNYDYAYPETVKIWMGVDTTYPVDDAFKQGAVGFRNYLPYFGQWIVAAIAACAMYLILLFYLTAVTGHDVDEDGKPYIRMSPFDRIPTETAFLIAAGVMILGSWIVIVVGELASRTGIVVLTDRLREAQWLMGVIAAGVFAADAVVMFFFYSLVRRIKAGTLWKNSYLRRIIYKIKELAWTMYDNGHIMVRTWVPYGIFLFFNFMVLLWAFASSGFGRVVALLIALIPDMLVGNLLYCNAKEQQEIVKGIETIAGGQLDHQVETENLHGDNLILAHSVNSIGNGIKEAVEISMKDERMKADLITNVSHDIKTPLTSIINYVDLIKREQVDNEKVQNYIRVLDEKSQRLKQLTDDLVEASKITSGNISLHFEKINLMELMNQTIGEFSEKFEEKNLTTIMNVNVQNAVIEADSRRIWRVIENLFNNIFKYAMEGTRVYVAISGIPQDKEHIEISIKNISASPLNCNPEELTERFIRGDESRTTEGSGLGLSIAKNLTEAQRGTFEIQLDGDLFKVILTFPLAAQ